MRGFAGSWGTCIVNVTNPLDDPQGLRILTLRQQSTGGQNCFRLTWAVSFLPKAALKIKERILGQECFNIHKSINMIHNMKDKNII